MSIFKNYELTGNCQTHPPSQQFCGQSLAWSEQAPAGLSEPGIKLSVVRFAEVINDKPHLVLLLLQSSLGLLKSGLELLLLKLKTAALFVKLLDGAASVAKLV